MSGPVVLPVRLQRLRGAAPDNRTALGKAVARAAAGLADDVERALACGFQDGGCLAFAQGLVDWSRGALTLRAVTMESRPGQVQHAVADLGGGLYLDSDGLGTAADVEAKMEAFQPGSGFRVDPGPFPAAHGLEEHAVLSAAVASAMGRELGPFADVVRAPLREGRPRALPLAGAGDSLAADNERSRAVNFMNEDEIDAAERSLRGTEAHRYAKFLSDYKDTVNRNSDGWPYWSPAVKAASRLIDAVRNAHHATRGFPKADMPTAREFQLTVTPVKTFLTKHNLPAVQLAAAGSEPEPAAPAFR